MRKALFTVALLLTAGVASAQVSVVKEAKSLLKKNPTEAAQKIEAALTNPETANDPNTWQVAGDAQKAIYDEENMKMAIPGNTADMTKLYSSLAKMFEYYLKCDEVEVAKVQSGELKKAKLRKKNAASLMAVRPNLANGGADAFNKQDYAAAQKFFGMYVDSANEPIFEDAAAIKADTLLSLYATYATMAAGLQENKDYDAIIKYGEIGKNHKDEGDKALMFMAEAYVRPEAVDSTKWLAVIKEGSERFPAEEFFVGNIMDYYIKKGMVDEGLAQINTLLTSIETPYYLYVKGILLFEKKQYEDAVVTLKKIVEKNEKLVAEACSKIGDCYFFPGQELVEINSTLDVQDPKFAANEAQIKDLYGKARPYYEKAKELAPDNDSLWGRYLLNIYWVLKLPEYEAMAKYLGLE